MKIPLKHSSRKRPFGVSVIIFMIFLYLLLLILVVFALLRDQIISLWLLDYVSPKLSIIVLLIVTLFLLAISLGLWRLQRWAWMLLMIWQGLSMAMVIWARIHGDPSDHLTMIINVIIVFYINQREVKKAFSGRTLVGEKWTI